jgi:hypothetical protein
MGEKLMALAAPKLKIKTPSSLKEFSLYTSIDDLITPLEPLLVRAGSDTLYAALYPPKTITGDNAYIYTKSKKYRIKEDNTVPIPTSWTNYSAPWGLLGDIAAGNGIFMYVGHAQLSASSQEFRSYTSTDGINWIKKNDPFPPISGISEPHLAFHHNNFYCTYGNNLVYSADGNKWTKFTPFGLRDGYTHGVWVNYWNQKFAYFLGESNNNNNYEMLVGEDADIASSIGNEIYNKGYSGSQFPRAFFWGKHFYIFGEDKNFQHVLVHLDSTNNGRQPSISIPNIPMGTSVSENFFPFGPFLFIGNSITPDGYNFVSAEIPVDSNVVLVKGDDLSRRMGIFSVYNADNSNYVWYAYDYSAPTGYFPILIAPKKIGNIVSAAGTYLAQEYNETNSRPQRLWVAYAP